ncbi:kit ligand-like isoform X2 [Megalops cyprinoides]|uniref:kit ligand-like isoform X2 n=1 Tax=Megalops cyprinoides TaxID=118141 RepID=UPI0018655A8E|nr:kit ligand-like isoform X2 [Megalops cyprinoides]
MKKAKIWIRACVCVLIYTTFAACSRGTGNPTSDDDDRISLLKQNIPKDYKIPVRFVPKEVSGMCWVELNVFHLEVSLTALAEMFGNISSNRNDISVLVQMLQDVRYRIGNDLMMMEEFECHYKDEKWQTANYFDYVKDFLAAAASENKSTGCDSPSCPTTIATPSTPTPTATEPLTSSPKVSGCVTAPDCSMRTERQYFPEVVQKSLLSLLLIPTAAVVCLLVWKVKNRRRAPSSEGNPESGDLFHTVEENRPPLDDISEEKNKLNTIQAM